MLFGLANSLRSLTRSPIAGALHEARRMARRPLEKGGTVPAHEDADDASGDFVVPSDVDPRLLATEIDAKLHGGRLRAGLGDEALQLLERRAGGRVAVPGRHILRLGDGRFDLGRRFLLGVIGKSRGRR